MPRRELLAPSGRSWSKLPMMATWPLSVMGAPEHCSIATSRACQSADVMISRRPMVETGLHSIGRAGNSCTPDGARSTRRYQRASRDHDGDSDVFWCCCLSVREFACPDNGRRIADVEMKIAPFLARAEWSVILVAFAAISPVGVALGQTTPASSIVSNCRSPADRAGIFLG